MRRERDGLGGTWWPIGFSDYSSGGSTSVRERGSLEDGELEQGRDTGTSGAVYPPWLSFAHSTSKDRKRKTSIETSLNSNFLLCCWCVSGSLTAAPGRANRAHASCLPTVTFPRPLRSIMAAPPPPPVRDPYGERWPHGIEPAVKIIIDPDKMSPSDDVWVIHQVRPALRSVRRRR